MAFVEIVIGGKGVGIADQASIDITKGCKNKCVGCYAAKTSRMGKAFFTDSPIIKEFDGEVFRKSCKRAVAKGIKICRLGKHSDSGDIAVLGITNQVLQITAEEEIQCVFVSKSLGFNEETAKLIKDGNHILHISLGMLTEAPENGIRWRTYRLFKRYGCNAKVRIVEDVTKPMSDEYKAFKLLPEDVLLTPMRFNSMADAYIYGAELSKFKWIDGYYRPMLEHIHPDWSQFKFVCGEIVSGKETIELCSNCLVRS